ncbi:hypothetical protein R1flu_024964 [Riccia fluitans]|uniref:Uncharacterized protein n=1 Tax=Riccia fluitans TaxID=41844 RepID=A0ABD1XWI5_9MARC
MVNGLYPCRFGAISIVHDEISGNYRRRSKLDGEFLDLPKGSRKSVESLMESMEKSKDEEEEFYNPPRVTEGFDTATTLMDKLLDKTLTTLDGPLTTVPPSTTGWSVHDNPLATGYSYTQEAVRDEDENVIIPKPFGLRYLYTCQLRGANSDNDDEGVIHPQPFCKQTPGFGIYDVRSSSSSTSSVEHNSDSKRTKRAEEDEDDDISSFGEESVASEMSSTCKILFPSIKSSSKLNETGEAEIVPAVGSFITQEDCPGSTSGADLEVKNSLEMPREIGTVKGELEVSSALPLEVQVSGTNSEMPSTGRRGVLSFTNLVIGGTLLLAWAFPLAVMIILEIVETSSRHNVTRIPT